MFIMYSNVEAFVLREYDDACAASKPQKYVIIFGFATVCSTIRFVLLYMLVLRLFAG